MLTHGQSASNAANTKHAPEPKKPIRTVLRKGREYSNPQNRTQKIVKGDRYDVKFNSDKSLEAAMPTP